MKFLKFASLFVALIVGITTAIITSWKIVELINEDSRDLVGIVTQGSYHMLPDCGGKGGLEKTEFYKSINKINRRKYTYCNYVSITNKKETMLENVKIYIPEISLAVIKRESSESILCETNNKISIGNMDVMEKVEVIAWGRWDYNIIGKMRITHKNGIGEIKLEKDIKDRFEYVIETMLYNLAVIAIVLSVLGVYLAYKKKNLIIKWE